MRNYEIALANTYYAVDSPLQVNVGYYQTKLSGYKCITQLSNSEFQLNLFSSGLIDIGNNRILAKNSDSYTIFIIDPSQSDNIPIPFSFYTFQNLYIVNNEVLNSILNQELPMIFNPNQPFNAINNAGTVSVLLKVYNTCYDLFYNSTTSIGLGTSYNSNWEYIYLGINNILQNAVYPAEFLKTMMNINTQCSIQGYSLAITFSRLVYQFIGEAVPVQIVYDNDTSQYLVNIYYNVPDVWSLGTVGFSELDDTTFLLGTGTSFLWVINKIVTRLMPAQVKWIIQYLSRDTFNTDFNISDVDTNDFYDPAVLYDAYMVVNNKNNFNTQGFDLNG